MASPFSVETVLRVAFALCPCLRWAKRELKKQQQQSMLADGTIFVRQTLKASDAIRRAAATLSSVTSMFGKKADAPEALCDSTRVRVRLRADGLSLSVAPIASEEDDDVVYLHDVRRVEAKGAAALVVFGKDDFVLFEGAAVDKKTRDAWVNALDSAAKEAASKPPPPREKRAAGMMGGSARRATREVELQTKKRDAEKKKSEYMKGTGGGMKYTAIAMAERMTNATV
ncbi:hypothetical protein M885DRAFT_506114 [Pelagophyceae sp. CCMP2097]|nr:hypothetical protein M885DRAFT_506114 [Pelagophyceae sp. CCMP2097]